MTRTIKILCSEKKKILLFGQFGIRQGEYSSIKQIIVIIIIINMGIYSGSKKFELDKDWISMKCK